MLNAFFFKSTFPLFALGPASMSLHIRSIIRPQDVYVRILEPRNQQTLVGEFQSQGLLEAGKPVYSVGITLQTPRTYGFLCTGSRLNTVGVPGTGTRDQEGREGRWKAGPEKGFTQESRNMWRNSYPWEHSHKEGPLKADGVPKTVILKEHPRQVRHGWRVTGGNYKLVLSIYFYSKCIQG